MFNRKSIASILIYLGSTLCFLLPFVTVSCQGDKVFTLTGQQLASGSTISQPNSFGPSTEHKVDVHPFASIALFCAIAGAALSLTGQRMIAASAISGGVGAASLLVMRIQMDGEIQRELGGAAQTSYEYGYTLTLFLLIAGASWNAYQIYRQRRESFARITRASSEPKKSFFNSQHRTNHVHRDHCTQCGSLQDGASKFCGDCGALYTDQSLQ
jgi:hypothetical protein